MGSDRRVQWLQEITDIESLLTRIEGAHDDRSIKSRQTLVAKTARLWQRLADLEESTITEGAKVIANRDSAQEING